MKKNKSHKSGIKLTPLLEHAVYFASVIDMVEKLAPPFGRYIFVSKNEGIEATCVFCGEINSHKPDCIWLEARKLLEELK